jgi:hypothetical protein
MNLLCPNCQKMLTVPEQYAGQLMKCPLCAGTFTVPALPPAAPPPPPPPGPDIFNFKDPVPPAPPLSTAPTMQPSAPPSPPPPPPPPLPPGEYTRKASVWFSPKVLQFVPPVLFFLIFVLQFFNWVGVYPGGYAAATENAWGVVIGSANDDPNMRKVFKFTTDEELKDLNKSKDDKDKTKDDKDKIKDNRPSWGPLTLFYLLCFLALFVLTLAATAIGLIPMKLPPAISPFLPWRWGVIFALNLLLFLILVLQLVVGFPLESSMRTWADSVANREEKAMRSEKDSSDSEKRDTVQETTYKVLAGRHATEVERTSWLTLVVVLHLLAIFTTLLLFWLEQRERFKKPLPELNLRW